MTHDPQPHRPDEVVLDRDVLIQECTDRERNRLTVTARRRLSEEETSDVAARLGELLVGLHGVATDG